ncbi:ATP-binding cassette domain-containing protein [Jeotgalibaca sp. MA1X17-3]|uniref:ABC transporter ATP-binding protein n=1 Tax=Jeotgalibaca sp. MA1X17-3 TaxID=2908211 RepID=UPI001F474DE7|nr:ATP-binding cassette domain-containing protein [Jeotgalibaca sp. MA1X17-3]UJF15577.1 ATP-binding cassette domain-containing protein [Jeotgalibaca sp. MA1X17-3]
MTQKRKKLLEVKRLNQYFNEGKANEVRAVQDLSFFIYEGETFGLVGESGSGKSTTGKLITKLQEATSGEITFDGKDISHVKKRKDLQAFRKSVQMVFQDPYASLNPKKTVMEIIGGGLEVHGLTQTQAEKEAKVYELLELVGLNPEYATRYPREFSGGQCQRVGIARALAVSPSFIVADEAISALDVSIQAQIVNLMKKLKKERKLTYLFIAHDLSMVKYISDRIGVMNGGRLLEIAPADDLYNCPLHPYTESLLSAVPVPDPDKERQRKRIGYDETFHQYANDSEVALYEVAPEHYVYCSKQEIPFLRKKHERAMDQVEQNNTYEKAGVSWNVQQ